MAYHSPARGFNFMSPHRSPQSLRPSSPLSPRMDSLAVPSHPSRRRVTGPSSRAGSRRPSSSMQLPSLPRFHPANFPSNNGSASSTPATGVPSPQQPTSPRNAQRQLHMYQRELATQASRGIRGTAPTVAASGSKPISPRLIPLGSPGPVTPLELEQAGQDYFVRKPGTPSTPGLEETKRGDILGQLVQQEDQRRRESTPNRSSPRTSTGR